MLTLKLMLITLAVALFTIALAIVVYDLVVYDLWFASASPRRARISGETVPPAEVPVRWRTSVALVVLAWMPLLLALGIAVTRSGEAGARVMSGQAIVEQNVERLPYPLRRVNATIHSSANRSIQTTAPPENLETSIFLPLLDILVRCR
jgi:hypothetical protein